MQKSPKKLIQAYAMHHPTFPVAAADVKEREAIDSYAV